MGGAAWGGHLQCPGPAIVRQRSLIIRAADGLLHGHRFKLNFDPTGRWQVKVDKWTWTYTFLDNGKVTWVDPFNGMTGTGKWKVVGEVISFTWVNSTTKESWELPLDGKLQRGKCTMKGKTYDLSAFRV
jgi:hypothetical protein